MSRTQGEGVNGADFDETIESELSRADLWRLLVEAFEESVSSPLWPDELEVLEVAELEEGAVVSGQYRFGPFTSEAAYAIDAFDEGEAFRYRTGPAHPLEGGARVEVEERSGEGSRLRWSGSYRSGGGIRGTVALGFLRAYFLEAFFERLRSNLRAHERQRRR